MVKRIIWINDVDTSDKAIAQCRAEVFEGNLDVSEDAVIQSLYDENSFWLDDERRNLDIEIRNPILVVANLDLWRGRRTGYRVLTGENVNEIFSVTCGDYVTFYADAYNIHCDDTHHDGTNHYLFRELIGDEDKCAPLLDAIYEQKDEEVIKKTAAAVFPVYFALCGRRLRLACCRSETEDGGIKGEKGEKADEIQSCKEPAQQ